MRKYAIISLLVLTAALGACKNQKNISKTMPPAEPVMTAAPATAPEPAPAPETSTAARSTESIISDYFNEIAHANSVLAANRSREEVLSLFQDKETPVLIVIYQEGDFKDYDEPTTINKYLEYLQLQGKNPAKVQSIVKNGQGKITELELLQQK